MAKHMELFHGGADPTFMMRVVQYHRSALSRQCGEAVRIMRRGGAGSVLNSRAEFNRCYIPRLKVEEHDKVRELELLEEQELADVKENLLADDRNWEQKKGKARSTAARSSMEHVSSIKRNGAKQGAGRRRKRLKYDIVEDDWGAVKTSKTTSEEAKGAVEDTGAGGLEVSGAVPKGAAPGRGDQPKDGHQNCP